MTKIVYKGIAEARNKPISQTAARTDLNRSDVPAGFNLPSLKSGIPGLSTFKIKCLMLQLAYMESKYDIAKWEGDSAAVALRYGRYLTSRHRLYLYGYLDATKVVWQGKDGIFDYTELLTSFALQDLIVKKFLEEAYRKLSFNGGFQIGDSDDIIAGMLAVAYQLNDLSDFDVKSSLWRVNGTQTDSKKRPCYLYFNAGRYAVSSLAANTTA